MGEYAAFPYLCHKEVEHVRVVYDVLKPLEFDELYTPRGATVPSTTSNTVIGTNANNLNNLNNDIIRIYKNEKSYWRTRDRIMYEIYESRMTKCLFITCYNIELKENYRTIFLDLEILYQEIQWKATATATGTSDREIIYKKKDLKIDNNKELFKLTIEYVLARLMIKAEVLPWPDLNSNTNTKDINSDTSTVVPIDKIVPIVSIVTNPNPTPDSNTDSNPVPNPVPNSIPERMCTFDKLSSDIYDIMEISPPSKLKSILMGTGTSGNNDGTSGDSICTATAIGTDGATTVIEHIKMEPIVIEIPMVIPVPVVVELVADIPVEVVGTGKGIDTASDTVVEVTKTNTKDTKTTPTPTGTTKTKPKGNTSTVTPNPTLSTKSNTNTKPTPTNKTSTKNKINPKKVMPI